MRAGWSSVINCEPQPVRPTPSSLTADEIEAHKGATLESIKRMLAEAADSMTNLPYDKNKRGDEVDFRRSSPTGRRHDPRELPRHVHDQQVMAELNWEKNKARQAIVMGLSQDFFRALSEERNTQLVIYENVRWRRNWLTKPWVSDWVQELAA